ncbi:MAG TPA: adenylyltransferase/cytidyltransferase family protein [Opitutales bacterium]|nr:adenylyltransferase/cytidyltransferase family protein [Opitutales bacterium]
MPETPKLRTLEAAVARREELRAAGTLVVLTNGVFDLLHPGHLHYLRAAAEKGGALFIALNGDASVRALKGPTRPVQKAPERAQNLGALDFVDTIFIFDTPRLDREIRAIRPDVYVKAGDYTLEKLDPGERAALQECGARIEFMSFLPGHSTTEIIKKMNAPKS